jgi:hypothetical protein
MARFPKYIPTDDQRRQVLSLTGLGITYVEIAKLFDINISTLRKHYRYELDTGATVANAKVAQSLFENATKHNNAAAQIWWTRARMGWRSETDLNVNSIQTIQMQHLVAARAFSDALHNNPDALPAPEIEGEVDEGNEAPETDDIMQPAAE